MGYLKKIKLIGNRWAWELVPKVLAGGLTQTRQSTEVYLKTLRARTTHAAASQPAPSYWREFTGKSYLPDQSILTYTQGGRGGNQNPQKICAKWSTTISKATQMQMWETLILPYDHPTGQGPPPPPQVTYTKGKIADYIGSRLTFPKWFI